MQYIFNSDNWEVTYTDSNGSLQRFFHPTIINRSMNGPQSVTADMIQSAFPTDAETESYINYMRANDIKFDDGSQP